MPARKSSEPKPRRTASKFLILPPDFNPVDATREEVSAFSRLDLKAHWPDMPEGGDVSGWLDRGHTAAEVEALIENAPDYSPPAPASEPSPNEPSTNWPILNDQKKPMPVVANVLFALRVAPGLAKLIAYDELLRAAVLTAEPPLVANARPASRDPLPRPVVDEHVTQIQEWLQWHGLPRIGLAAVHQAVDLRARETPFHRLREWLDGLRWDKKPRLDQWLATYLGAKPSDYHAAIGKMFLIAMVARVFEPGCKCDYVVILQGAQGELKSAACRVLGGEWLSDTMPDIRTKDANQHVRGLWLIELPELSALSRGDIEMWKAFVTRAVERYRPFYGRRETIEPRQCLFVGTTNKDEFPQDETGNRRFWPVAVGAIRLDALKRDRAQLFAEAVHRYRAGEQWWPDKEFERSVIAPEQEERFEIDAWEAPIADWLRRTTQDRVQVCEVARSALNFTADAHVGTADQRRITRILNRLKWRRAKDWRGRFYARPIEEAS